jgi:hypothetical protein
MRIAGEASEIIPDIGEVISLATEIVEGIFVIIEDIILAANPVTCYYLRASEGPTDIRDVRYSKTFTWKTGTSCKSDPDCSFDECSKFGAFNFYCHVEGKPENKNKDGVCACDSYFI